MDEQNLQDSYVGLCTEPPTSISASLLGFSYVETRGKAQQVRWMDKILHDPQHDKHVIVENAPSKCCKEANVKI